MFGMGCCGIGWLFRELGNAIIETAVAIAVIIVVVIVRVVA